MKHPWHTWTGVDEKPATQKTEAKSRTPEQEQEVNRRAIRHANEDFHFLRERDPLFKH